MGVPKVVFLDRTQQRTVVHTWDTPDPQVVEELVDTLSGDEEVEFYSQRSELLRRRDHEWELGHTKLLLHKKTGKIRFMLRDEIATKIVGFFSSSSMILRTAN